MSACPVCTFVNSANWSVCTMCGTSNPSVVIHTTETPKTCPICTFEAKPSSIQCEMCGCPLGTPGENDMTDETGPGWRCPACTMWQTDLEDARCTMCATVNFAIQQQIEEKEKKKREEEEKKQKEAEEERKKQEEERKRKEKTKITDTVRVLEAALLLLRSNQQGNTAEILKLLESLYSYIDTSQYPAKEAHNPTECEICGSQFDKECKSVTIHHCGHRTACEDCFGQYISHRIRDKDVLPFVRCPAPNCKVNLKASEIVGSGTPGDMLCDLIVIHSTKTLSREENWVPCLTDKCQNGFLLPPLPAQPPKVVEKPKRGKFPLFQAAPTPEEPAVKMTCAVCRKEQGVKRKVEELDNEFKKMIADGVLRPCPKCQHMTLKEYGVCNVIECVKCAIWWNWRSRDTGATSHELKQRARSTGTLWEAGELAFQQKLEHSDPKKFRELLERNGVKYNPNYTRGT